MQAGNLFDALKKTYELSSDSDLASFVGLTAARISQLRSKQTELTTAQIDKFLKKSRDHDRLAAFRKSIRPIVEMYPIEATRSTQDAKWELFPTKKEDLGNQALIQRNQALRKHLEKPQGLYMFYDSQGCVIYAGKTERLGLWKEMTNAFNRERANHQAYKVAHPTTGATFTPAWKMPRQPKKQIVYMYDTAHYFSAYEVTSGLIKSLEALVIRAFCNSLSNKKMENFPIY